LKQNSAVRFSQIKPKLSYLAIGKAQLNACAFSDGVEKQKCCLGPGNIIIVITSVQLFNLKLGRMLCNSYSNRFCDSYIFLIVGIGVINFQSIKTGNPFLFSGVIFLQKKWTNYLILFFVNYTM